MTSPAPHTVVDDLRRSGIGPGDLVAVAVDAGDEPGSIDGALAFGPDGDRRSIVVADAAPALRSIDAELRPRWVTWSGAAARTLIAAGVRPATCWDLAAVHRLLVGGWRAEPGLVWAHVRQLAADNIPRRAPVDLFSTLDEEPDEPVRPDGHLNPDWGADGWSWNETRLMRWSEAALAAAHVQQAMAGELGGSRMMSTARSESTAELLCAELSLDGLPMDRAAAETIIGDLVGPRPANEAEATAQRRRRDDEVLAHAPGATDIDLRNPAHVRSLLRRVGVEAPDTRAWRLESLRDAHPVVEALLTWRKAERIATTFGYTWLDEHLGPDGRLRGAWSAADGAAGRMTASAGLHNMPALVRSAVVAEPGHLFVRADLGQIEPRVLAAVSADPLLAAATSADDLYAPVAEALGVDRATAKVAVLGAMYGQTTGHGAQALRRLERAYPIAMQYLLDADLAAQAGRDLRTYGGRAIRMSAAFDESIDDREGRSRAAARGRYGRNAMVQGAAAEMFKVWAVTVRARAAALGAHIVLCLHDELLVHVPASEAPQAESLLRDCLAEAAHRWAPDASVRFVAEISTVTRWSDAKA